ncbi:hypothetical protein [Winogradskyella sp.]|uniref:hypothetical protein n=1 Tax=Winogradskyella sp. TaxID=1883156 RepID=UPI003BAA0E42
MSSDKYQLVPFPIPEHLVYYFSRKLGCEVEDLPDGSKCTKSVITKDSFYGETLYQSLEVSKSMKKTNSNFYIKIRSSICQDYKGMPDGRYNKYHLSKSALQFVIKHLKQVLKTELIAFVDGAVYANLKIKGTKKGITHNAIAQFMFRNRIHINKLTFESLRKMQYRAKKSNKPLIIK